MKNVLRFIRVSFIVMLLVSVTCKDAKTQVLWGMNSGGGGKNGGGNIFSLNTDGTGFLERYAFLADGEHPSGQRLLDYGDGFLYGIVGSFQQVNGGILYKMMPDGSNYQVLYNFQNGVSPACGVIKGADGYLYGTTTFGGTAGKGVVYKISNSGTGYQVLHNFITTDGASPSTELKELGGSLYGTAAAGGSNGKGVVYTLKTDGTGFSVLHHFTGTDGNGPNGPLEIITNRGGSILYGTTGSGGGGGIGVLYKLTTTGLNFQVLYNFVTATGANPNGPLLKQGVAGGIFYGTTRMGGSNNAGTVYAFNTVTNAIQVLHNFPYDASNFYERYPNGELVYVNSVLYGSTELGGNFHDGVLFKLNTDGTAYQVLHEYNDLNSTSGNLSYFNSQIYGLTRGGQVAAGESNGTIYRLNPDGSSFQQIHGFNNTNGYGPSGSLIHAQDGNLYGLTTFGGSGFSDGLAFSINTDGTAYNPLQWLDNGPASGKPQGSLVQAGNGSFYGMNNTSGPAFAGSVFKLTVNPLSYQQFFPFCLAPGCAEYPSGSLIQASDGNLYGMTPYGSQTTSQGSIFRINTSGTGYIILHPFTGGAAGGNPAGSLIQAPDGFLYGMTQNGGLNDFGVIFKMKTDGTAFQIIFQLGTNASSGANGVHPAGSLLRGADGKLYGMANRGGVYSLGTIFRINSDGTGFQVIYNFNGTNGAYPVASLIQDPNSTVLYGMANLGGTGNMGTVFKINTDGSGFLKLMDFNGINGKYPKGDLLLVAAGAPLMLKNPAKITEANTSVSDAGFIEIAPNPVHNVFNIHFQNALKGKTSFSIVDINGKTVRQNIIPDIEGGAYHRVDVADLPAGIYLVKVIVAGRQFVKKIVKQ
jgi:uncharacterized repeat protein (TIGR03803 family)